MSTTVLITGVSGFIGRHVAEEALRRGYRVTGIDRHPCPLAGVEFIEADIRDVDRVARAVGSAEAVIHLAAITSNVEFMKTPAECYDINVNGFLTVIDAAARHGCRRFVYASSAAVYADTFSEDTVMDVRTRTNHYAKTKIINEMMAASYEEIGPLGTTGLRYFNVYGTGENAKGDYASIVTLFLKARTHAEPLVVYGDGTQARDLIHVTDAARVTLAALEKGSRPVYNVGTGAATPYAAIAAMIDPHHVTYVPNPLTSYQYYTRADTARMRELIGDGALTDLRDGIVAMSRP
jgi:UDP-glucose 4-epimerase